MFYPSVPAQNSGQEAQINTDQPEYHINRKCAKVSTDCEVQASSLSSVRHASDVTRACGAAAALPADACPRLPGVG